MHWVLTSGIISVFSLAACCASLRAQSIFLETHPRDLYSTLGYVACDTLVPISPMINFAFRKAPLCSWMHQDLYITCTFIVSNTKRKHFFYFALVIKIDMLLKASRRFCWAKSGLKNLSCHGRKPTLQQNVKTKCTTSQLAKNKLCSTKYHISPRIQHDWEFRLLRGVFLPSRALA